VAADARQEFRKGVGWAQKPFLPLTKRVIWASCRDCLCMLVGVSVQGHGWCV